MYVWSSSSLQHPRKAASPSHIIIVVARRFGQTPNRWRHYANRGDQHTFCHQRHLPPVDFSIQKIPLCFRTFRWCRPWRPFLRVFVAKSGIPLHDRKEFICWRISERCNCFTKLYKKARLSTWLADFSNQIRNEKSPNVV